MINSTSEWLLIAQDKAKWNYATHKCYQPQTFQENILLTGKDRHVYAIHVYSTLYSLHQIVLVQFTSLQVYSTLDSLQEIVATHKSLTNQRVITLS